MFRFLTVVRYIDRMWTNSHRILLGNGALNSQIKNIHRTLALAKPLILKTQTGGVNDTDLAKVDGQSVGFFPMRL